MSLVVFILKLSSSMGEVVFYSEVLPAYIWACISSYVRVYEKVIHTCKEAFIQLLDISSQYCDTELRTHEIFFSVQ
jgi:hypothetical protein